MPATATLSALPPPPALKTLFQTAWGSECRASAATLLGVQLLVGLAPAAQVALTARLLDAVLPLAHSGAPRFALALAPAAGLIAVTILRSVLTFAAGIAQQRLGLDLRHALDGRTLAVAARSPLALFDRSDWYDLLQAAGTSAGAAAEKVFEQVSWLLQRMVGVITVGLLLATAAWWLPPALFAGIVPTAFWELWQGDRQRRHTLDQAQDRRLLTYLGSLLAGDAGEGEAAEVRLYGLAGHLLRRWRALFSRLGTAQVRFQAVQAAAEFPVQMLNNALFLGGLVVLGLAVFHGHLRTGSFMALVGGLGSFSGDAAAAAACVRRIRIRGNALADFGRLAVAAGLPVAGPLPDGYDRTPAPEGVWADAVRPEGAPARAGTAPRAAPAPNALEDAPPPAGAPTAAPARAGTAAPAPHTPPPAPAHTRPSRPPVLATSPFPRPLRCGIAFDRVTFAYAGSAHPALQGLDLTLRAGECLALVGANGSGKSTLVKLLLGLYAPDQGRVLADGRDLAAVAPEARRAAIAPVFQDHLRLQLTAAEAIGFGNLSNFLKGDADPTRLHRAARAAGAAPFLEALPLRYDTPLGRSLDDRGVDLSGGQWQRLAIGRALYAEPEVLVLDEPAAALDPQAEAELYGQFTGLTTGGRTTLLITHRLGAARIADRIAVLDGGRIAEEGTHVQLVAAGGLYARMWAAQAEWYR